MLNRARLAALGAALLCSACVNLPYIEPTRHAPQGRSHGSLEDAVDYLDRNYDAYEAKIIEEWHRQQGLATALIGAGAVGIGAAIAHAHRDAFAVLGVGSAAAYQLGSWNANAGRNGIYLEGMKALVCAKAAVQPLRLGRDARARIREAQGALLVAIERAAQGVDLAGRARATSAEESVAKTLRDEVQALQGDLDAAQQLLARSSSMDQRIDGAGAMLQQKVDDIRNVINAALNATQADISSLRTSIQGIASFATQFNGDVQGAGLAIAKALAPAQAAPATNPLDKKESKGKGGEEPQAASAIEVTAGQALGAVSAARVVVRAATARLRGTVDRPVDSVSANLGGCGVDASKLGTPPVLEESTLTLKEGQVRTAMFEIRSGTKPFQLVSLDAPAPGLTATISPEGGTLIIVSDTTTKEGSYRYRARDAAGNAVTFTVTVTNAEGGGNTGSTGNTGNKGVTGGAGKGNDAKESLGAASICDDLRSLSKAKVCYVQRMLGADVDGMAGPQTCKALRKGAIAEAKTARAALETLARRSGLSATSSDDEFMAKLGARDEATCRAGTVTGAAVGAPPGTAAAPAERPLSADEVRRLSLALGRPPVTDVKQLREALRENQYRNKCTSTNGEFTAAEVDRLLNRDGKCS